MDSKAGVSKDRESRSFHRDTSHKTKAWKKKSDTNAYKGYIGNKDEGQGFADKRKRKAKFEYVKLLQKEAKKNKAIGTEPSQHKSMKEVFTEERLQSKGSKFHSFWGAEKIARDRQRKRQEEREKNQAIRAEKDAALSLYKSKKKSNHLKLCKKTRKGQPVMKMQMEVLLDKIKKQKGLD